MLFQGGELIVQWDTISVWRSNCTMGHYFMVENIKHGKTNTFDDSLRLQGKTDTCIQHATAFT